jgi:hypothetical protein
MHATQLSQNYNLVLKRYYFSGHYNGVVSKYVLNLYFIKQHV